MDLRRAASRHIPPARLLPPQDTTCRLHPTCPNPQLAVRSSLLSHLGRFPSRTGTRWRTLRGELTPADVSPQDRGRLGPLGSVTSSRLLAEEGRKWIYPEEVLTRACPAVGTTSPLSILNVVVFPAPFAPRSPKH